MTVTEYLLFLQEIISVFPFTVLDIIFLICAIIYIASEKHRPFVRAFIIMLAVLFAWGAALLLYAPISAYLQSIFFAPKGVADGFTLLVIIGAIGAGLAVVYRLFVINADHDLLDKEVPVVNSIFGGITFALICSALLTILLSFPLTTFIKTTISQSFVLSSLVSYSQAMESAEQKVVGKDSTSTLNFLTVKPTDGDTEFISRGMLFSPDESAEREILKQLNEVRNRTGSPAVQASDSVSSVAQALAMRMVSRNQLSRTDISGSTPFDLLQRSKTVYSQAYFISAQAQTIKIAVQGLTQIPQYQSEMTSPRYQSVGIGAVSLKEHGYIITLLFTD